MTTHVEWETVLLMTKMELKITSQSLNNVIDALINWGGLSDGSDVLAEEMKIGKEFYYMPVLVILVNWMNFCQIIYPKLSGYKYTEFG